MKVATVRKNAANVTSYMQLGAIRSNVKLVMKTSARPDQTNTFELAPLLNERIIARSRIVVKVPFSLRLPAASAAG